MLCQPRSRGGATGPRFAPAPFGTRERPPLAHRVPSFSWKNQPQYYFFALRTGPSTLHVRIM